MAKNKDNLLTMIDENGKEVTCEILFTYHSDKFNKDYVLFIPQGAEDSDEVDVEVGAAVYTENGEDGGELLPVETDEEWAMLSDVLDEYMDDEEAADEE